MRGFQRRIRSTLLLILVLGLLATLALAGGSEGAPFTGSFNYSGASFRSQGIKSDQGQSSYSYATVATQTWFMEDDNATLTYVVKTVNGTAVTGSYGVSGTGMINIPYTTNVTNGSLYLHGTSSSAGAVTGIWYP